MGLGTSINEAEWVGKTDSKSLSLPRQQVVLDVAVMEEQLRELREHLQDVIKSAHCNMRRGELWKGMLYGKQRTDTKPSSVREFLHTSDI